MTPPEPDDAALVVRARAGDGAAFALIVARHKQALYRLVYRIVDHPDDALDLVQDSFVAAHQALRRYDPARPLRPWLATIAINKARDWRRRERVRGFLRGLLPIGDALETRDDTALPDTIAADRQALASVRVRIAALPANLRDVLVLRTLEEMSQADTARILGVSEKAVETRLYRARQRIAENP